MKKVTIFMVICFFSVSGIGLAEGPMGMGELEMPMGKWWRMPEMVKKLDLTNEEQQKLDDLFIQTQRRMIDLMSNVQKEKLELELILDQQNFDEAACMQQFKKFRDTRGNVANERFKFLIEVRKLMGLDRYQQLKAEFREHRMHRMREHLGKKRLMRPDMGEESEEN